MFDLMNTSFPELERLRGVGYETAESSAQILGANTQN